MRLLSLCTGMGMMDRAYLDAGFDVVPGCEIDPEMRQMYRLLCGGKPLVEDIADLPRRVRGMRFDGIIGGPPCQAHSSLRAMRAPKFADLTPHVERVLAACRWHFYKFENVVPLDLLMSRTVLLNAMHFYRPHQSRPRWFTYSGSLTPPQGRHQGDVDDLCAYSTVAGRIYGPKRGAILQGYRKASSLDVPCQILQKGLANAVPYPLALAWARQIRRSS